MVPEIEEREASRFNGYTWREWLALSYDDRVDGVAYFRITRYLDLIRADVESDEVERKSRSSA